LIFVYESIKIVILSSSLEDTNMCLESSKLEALHALVVYIIIYDCLFTLEM